MIRVRAGAGARAALWVGALGLWTLAACSRTGLGLPDATASGDGSVAPMDAGVDAADAGAREPVCIEVPPDGSPVRVSFTLPVALAVVDVMFLVDATGSMEHAIGAVRNALRRRVVPGVREAIPDAAFGLAYVGEFPVPPHGPSDVRPYELRTPITRDLLTLQSAFERHPVWGNYDHPEAQVEGLYQVATGAGLSPWIPASPGCPGGGLGGACFRRDALPVVMLVTDAPFHNGPPGVAPESRYEFTPAPHEYADALGALRALNAFVIGLGAVDPATPSPMRHLRAIARDTGALGPRGEPLVFDIGATGNRVGEAVVQAVEHLANDLPLDVSATVHDVAMSPVPIETLVRAVRPVQADPPEGIASMGDTSFFGVHPGTRVTFEIELSAEALEPSPETQVVPALVVFRAFGRHRLGDQPIQIRIPVREDEGCPAPDEAMET